MGDWAIELFGGIGDLFSSGLSGEEGLMGDWVTDLFAGRGGLFGEAFNFFWFSEKPIMFLIANILLLLNNLLAVD